MNVFLNLDISKSLFTPRNEVTDSLVAMADTQRGKRFTDGSFLVTHYTWVIPVGADELEQQNTRPPGPLLALFETDEDLQYLISPPM